MRGKWREKTKEVGGEESRKKTDMVKKKQRGGGGSVCACVYNQCVNYTALHLAIKITFSTNMLPIQNKPTTYTKLF